MSTVVKRREKKRFDYSKKVTVKASIRLYYCMDVWESERSAKEWAV